MERLKYLKNDQKRLETWIKSQGVVVCADPIETVGAENMFKAIARTFPAYIECCQYFYCYKCSEQPEKLRKDDGIAWRYCTPDKDELYAVGLSVEALEQGLSYATMVTLHELVHILCDIADICKVDEHNQYFHNVLDGLIRRYNRRNGTTGENDYFGLDARFDGRKRH